MSCRSVRHPGFRTKFHSARETSPKCRASVHGAVPGAERCVGRAGPHRFLPLLCNTTGDRYPSGHGNGVSLNGASLVSGS